MGEMQRATVLQDFPAFAQITGKWFEALIISLEQRDSGEAFLSAIEFTARQLMEQQISVAKLQDVLSAMRREGCRALDRHPIWLAQAENIWHQARVFLNEQTLQQQDQKRIQLNDQMAVLRAISQTMAVTFHLDNLMEILVRDLPQLGIESCYVSLYEGVNRPAEWTRLTLASDEGQRLMLRARSDIRPPRYCRPTCGANGNAPWCLKRWSFKGKKLALCCLKLGPTTVRFMKLCGANWAVPLRRGVV